MPPPFDLPEHVRRHGAGLRQLALELLGDAAAAEDAVQQVWLAAVQSPPRHQEAVGGWLARMVRNVAVDWRRAARRRSRREQVAVTAKSPVAEAPAETIARVEAARRLLTAVEALAEPYRGAIWQRFFDELPPRAIAAARGVPVATVKSWLSRGLELLRERLARTDGADWRMAFAVAFRLGERVARASVLGAGVLGGAIVATWMKLSIAAAVVLAAVFCWPSGAAATPVGAGSSAHAPPLATAADAHTALREPAPSAPATGPIAAATIRGRCVDRHGAPLARCVAQLSGWSASHERLEAWLRDHEPPQWRDPAPITTRDDGVFAIHFAPPVPFQFSLQVHSERHGAIAARWPQLEPTATVDLGDVEMGVGARLAGRVVDGSGLPVADTLVVVYRVDRRHGTSARDGDFDPASVSARCDERGEFVLPAPLLPGDYAVESKSAPQREPLVVHVEAGRDQRDLVVVVDRPEHTTIRGRVVDETGMPVADARVMGEPRPRGRFWTTDREGAFELRIPCAEAANPVDVVAESPRHEARAIAKTVAWGRSDVVLTLRNAARLELRVRDAERPVEQFTVRLLSRDYSSSDDSRVRARGPFAGGVAVLPGVRKGRWIAVLEFPTSAGLATAVVPFTVDATPLARLEVAAHRIGERTAVVVDETDRPVAGARIVLCHAVDAALDENTLLVTPETYPRSHGLPKAIVASEATTDDAGRATLQGPIDGRMDVALPGGAHVPAFVREVRLDDTAPLTIVVVRGARLRARVRTQSELDGLLRLCGITHGTIGAARRPTLLLLSTDGRTVPDLAAVITRGEAGGRGAMSDDGCFELGGLRRERFAMTLLYWPPGGGVEELSVGGVDLASVSEREVALDLSALVPGTLRGSLTVNGKPVALRAMRFEGPGKQEMQTDGSGRFEATLRRGVYRVFAAMSGSPHAFVPVAEGVTVRAKDDTALPIDVQTGRLRLRLVRGETPQSMRIALHATLATSAEPVRLPRLDPDDALEVELPAGTIRIAAAVDARLPRRAAPDAVHLDTVTIAAGATTAVELRLPPGFGR